jgi:Holliday junction resolvase
MSEQLDKETADIIKELETLLAEIDDEPIRGNVPNSNQKGKRGEREFAQELNKLFPMVNARRGVQYSGSPDSPDVVGLDGIHVEVKRTERLNLESAVNQACRDCGGNVPVVASRKNRGEWLLTIRLNDLREFAGAISGLIDSERINVTSAESTEHETISWTAPTFGETFP